MKIIFEASEAQYEPHELTGQPPIDVTQPARIVIDVPDDGSGPFVQTTYNTLRVSPHGDEVAGFIDGLWQTEIGLTVTEASMLDGTPVDPATVQSGGMLFTDIIVAP